MPQYGGFAQPDPANPVAGIFAQQQNAQLQKDAMRDQKKFQNRQLMLQMAGLLLGGGGLGGGGGFAFGGNRGGGGW